jgi:DNA-directed RNA polymerase subunit RPC12/RpoP
MHTKVTRDVPHILYLLLSIVTGGLWLIVWLLHSHFAAKAADRQPYLCTACGTPFDPSVLDELEEKRRLQAATVKAAETKVEKAFKKSAATGICPMCGVEMLRSTELGKSVLTCPQCRRVLT